ncbi:small ribosomal subunit protein uS14-like [Mustela lutreola]|uniref:small ribosomal subunit protein uS14-like n=1 Tax=Mustela lutreola TaxID=9666 RepID=UPI0027973801|nr:small ribosomal subunit protein uS14-like [Mustela lutreola]
MIHHPIHFSLLVKLSVLSFLRCCIRENKMAHQELYWSHLRKDVQGSCHICSNQQGLIQKNGLNICCQCFCQYAKETGFIKRD